MAQATLDALGRWQEAGREKVIHLDGRDFVRLWAEAAILEP